MLPTLNHPWADNAQAPVYLFAFPPNPEARQIHDFYDRLEEFYGQLTSPVSLVAILDRITSMGALERQIVAAREKKIASNRRQCIRGIALVASSAFTRGLVTAYYWINSPPYEHKTFKSKTEAVFWARKQLADDGSS